MIKIVIVITRPYIYKYNLFQGFINYPKMFINNFHIFVLLETITVQIRIPDKYYLQRAKYVLSRNLSLVEISTHPCHMSALLSPKKHFANALEIVKVWIS